MRAWDNATRTLLLALAFCSLASLPARAQSCTYTLPFHRLASGSQAFSTTITVTAPTGCAWTALSNVPWITITAGSSGSGSGTVNFSVAANTAGSSQTGTLTVAGQTVTVYQGGAISCSTSTVVPTSASFSAAGRTDTVIVTTPGGCVWVACAVQGPGFCQTPPSWLTLPDVFGSSGSRAVTYSVAANTATTSRTATVYFQFYGLDSAFLAFTVTQGGFSPNPAIGLGATSLIFNAQQGGANPASQSVSISNSGGGTLNWTATASTQSGLSWLSVSPASGANSGTITVAANIAGLSAAGSPYRGTIQVAAPVASNSPQTINVTLNITATASLAVAPASLSFTASAGGTAPPSQQLVISGAVAGIAWSAQASTQSGGGWLSVSPTSGTIPGVVLVSANAANLPAGTYRGTVTVQAPNASPSTQTVVVDLTVEPASPPQLSVQPSSLTVEVQAGAASAPPQTLRIGNAGGGTLNWTAQAGTLAGQNRLRLSATSGTASAGAPAAVLLTADLTGLAAGVYSAAVRVDSSTTNETKIIPLTLVVTRTAPAILLSPRGLAFTGVARGGAQSQSFAVLNAGPGSLAWTAQASTLAGGNWLSLSPSSGISTAGTLPFPTVDVSVNTAQLDAGHYSGLVRIDAQGASNSPQFVSVHLNVLPAGSNPGVEVRPAGLIFGTQAGGSSPASQTVRLTTAAPAGAHATVGVQTLEGGNWLDAAPRNVTVPSSGPAVITVQATLGSLAAGVYRGVLTLQFDDGSPAQGVRILFVVARTTGPEAETIPPGGAATCTPTRLVAVYRSLKDNFSSLLGTPSNIEVQVSDDCATPRSDATVVASFSNGDPEQKMDSLGNGIYATTWRSANLAGLTTVTVRANLPPLAEALLISKGVLANNPGIPIVIAGGIVSAASFTSGDALAPGSIFAVFGSSLASSTTGAPSLPLPTTLGGASLSVGGLDAPLFFSSEGQINAQLPFELSPNSRQQAVAKTSLAGKAPALAVPETITVAAARPGIFSTDSSGKGQGAIVIATGEFAFAAPAGSLPGRPARPARRGEDIVSIFSTGLGDVTNRPANGAAALTSPLSETLLKPTVTIGGVPATVGFSGLAPFFVGLYQVNVTVPTGAPTGDAISVALTMGGASSNTVTVAVQ